MATSSTDAATTTTDAAMHPAPDQRIPRRLRGYDRKAVDARVATLEEQAVELRTALVDAGDRCSDLEGRLRDTRGELRFLRDRESFVEAETTRVRREAGAILAEAREQAARQVAAARDDAAAIMADAREQAAQAMREAREHASAIDDAATERAARVEEQAQQRALALIERMTEEANGILAAARTDARETATRTRSELDTGRVRVDALARLQVEITEAMRTAMHRFERGLLDLEAAAPSRTTTTLTLPDRIRGELSTLSRVTRVTPPPTSPSTAPNVHRDAGMTTFSATVTDAD